jgi:hypothetical protein
MAAYKGIAAIREPLLVWLERRTAEVQPAEPISAS